MASAQCKWFKERKQLYISSNKELLHLLKKYPKWERLAPLDSLCPKNGRRAFQINENEFVMIADYGFCHKYNAISNSWSQFEFLTGAMNRWHRIYKAVITKSKRSIFILTRDRTLHELDIKSQSIKSPEREDMIFRNGVTDIICVGDHLHLFSDNTDTDVEHNYCLLRKEMGFQSFQTVVFETMLHESWKCNLIYLESKHCLISLDIQHGNVYTFDVRNSKWTKSKIKGNVKLKHNPKLIVTADERYVILLDHLSKETSGLVQLYDVENRTLTKSKIELPSSKRFFSAVMMRNEKRDELMAFGFVNHCFVSAEYEDIQKLPFYLIRLIAEWISNEWIHLIYCEENEHWKIHIDEVLNSAIDSS